MAEQDLINLVFVVIGGLIGSALITLFPYFNGKKALEEQKEAINNKPPETRTPEEKFILEQQSQGFFEEYKYRFFFGLLSGIGLVLAFLQGSLADLGNLTTGGAIFAGITASGFLTALADKIRDTGTATTVKATK